MEADGKSRVYITGGKETAWLVFPEAERTSYEDELTGDEARKVLDRTDFDCVNSEAFEYGRDGGFGKQLVDEWGCYDKEGNRFAVDRSTWSKEERYSKLAEVLEERTGLVGLTIVVS